MLTKNPSTSKTGEDYRKGYSPSALNCGTVNSCQEIVRKPVNGLNGIWVVDETGTDNPI